MLLLANSGVWAEQDFSLNSANEFGSKVASDWFELLYEVVKTERIPPPQASRIYGITSVALYESIVGGSKRNRSLAGQLNGLTSVPQPRKIRKQHWAVVANTVMANTIRGLIPTISQASLNAVNNLEQSFAARYQSRVSATNYARSVSHGQAVAPAILAWAATDRFSINNNCTYVPAAVAGAWEATPPQFAANPLQPCWGLIRPMVLTSGDECSPGGHPPFSNDPASAFLAAAMEVYNVGLNLTTGQKTVADYWSDGAGATGTPPGHWIAIVSQIARNDGLSLVEAAEAYARVGIAVHDAFIACWNVKFDTNLQRPVTFIRNNIDANWTPYITTPNFPTYTSGHSTQSAAASRVLTDMFGTKNFTDTTHTDHGLQPPQQPRTFSSFEQASAEAAVSRLFGGIHYTFDNNDGLAAGNCIGLAIRNRVNFKSAAQ
jgi:hypothetical protein